MRRRNFIKNTGLFAGGLAVLGQGAPFAGPRRANPLPRWRGFNVLDFFSPNPASNSKPTTEDHLRWMRDWGFDFVRVPKSSASICSMSRRCGKI